MNRRLRVAFDWVLGVTLILVGLVLSLPLVPGPGVVLIIAGLAVLSSHNRHAHRLYSRLKEQGLRLKNKELKKPQPDGTDQDYR